MTKEYRLREVELTSHLEIYLTGEMTTAGRLLSRIQETISIHEPSSKSLEQHFGSIK